MNDDILKKIIQLVNWFSAHLCSSYNKCDDVTKKHIDNLYLEFNERWKNIISTPIPPELESLVKAREKLNSWKISQGLDICSWYQSDYIRELEARVKQLENRE